MKTVREQLVEAAKAKPKVEGSMDASNFESAYMYPLLGHYLSQVVVDALSEAGYDDSEVEWIFRSKFTRWFSDSHFNDIQDATKKLVKKFLKSDTAKQLLKVMPKGGEKESE